jgi:hypothetical protein
MAYTFEQFTKEFVLDHLHLLSPGDILDHYSLDQMLEVLSPKEVLNYYTPKEIADCLSPEELQSLLERLEQRRQH